MSVLSCAVHLVHIDRCEDDTVLIDDEVLPAAVHLTGVGATDVLRAAVEAGGGNLRSASVAHVRYRPSADVVVRYSASVAWSGGPVVSETLLAATTVDGAPTGTLPLVAGDTDDPLEVGVWRWPFDPVLVGLTDAVTASTVATWLTGVVEGPLQLEVVAYRPTERAVVRVDAANGTQVYLKVVAPTVAERVVETHRRLLDAGVPVPDVVAVAPERGLVAMSALAGDTLRVRIKEDRPPFPPAEEYLALARALGSVELPGVEPVRGKLADALAHASMLATVMPDQRGRLDRLTDRLASGVDRSRARAGVTIHGDLYESQLVVDGTRIVGVLDIDDTGPGDPIDDLANVLAHLRYRAVTTPRLRTRLDGYADALRREFGRHVDVHELDLVTGAALVGLATGPFRVQQRHWQHEVRRVLHRAEQLLGGTARVAGTRVAATMSKVSASPHRRPTPVSDTDLDTPTSSTDTSMSEMAPDHDVEETCNE